MIGNKDDLEDSRAVDEDRGASGAKKLSKKYKFFETSAKEGTNVDTALNAVIELAASQVKDDDLYVAPSLNLNQTTRTKKKKKGCCKR